MLKIWLNIGFLTKHPKGPKWTIKKMQSINKSCGLTIMEKLEAEMTREKIYL